MRAMAVFKMITYLFILLFVFYLLYILFQKFPDNNGKTLITGKNTSTYVINMDKNKNRLERITTAYMNSDIKEIPFHRFPAVVGKNVNIDEWLTPTAIQELKDVENKQHRNFHYQLTRGAIGCFLSHYTLAKQLMTDKRNDYYLNLEDDVTIQKDGFQKIQEAILNVPENWDFILFGYNRLVKKEQVGNFILPSGFWGTHAMLMNKSGAKKLVDEVDTQKMDGQIDAYMSRMVQQGKLVIYVYQQQLIVPVGNTSDIQVQLRIKNNTDPFNFHGYVV
jgi:GR25 family glycosyltransferase involved in LPS biosynthesis